MKIDSEIWGLSSATTKLNRFSRVRNERKNGERARLRFYNWKTKKKNLITKCNDILIGRLRLPRKI